MKVEDKFDLYYCEEIVRKNITTLEDAVRVIVSSNIRPGETRMLYLKKFIPNLLKLEQRELSILLGRHRETVVRNMKQFKINK